MLTYIARRLLQVIPLLVIISMVSFFIMQLTPGDYLETLKMNPDISEELINDLKIKYGLDKNPVEQYFRWLWRVLHLDFGRSFKWNAPVTDVIGSRLLNTLILSLAAMVISWGIAIPIGVHSAVKKYSWSDNILGIFAFIGLSIPNFFFALLLLFLIVKFNLNLPIGGMTSVDYEWLSPWAKIIDILKHLLVPAIVLGTASVAGLMRQMRGQMIDVMREDYIRTARAKGLKEKKVIYKHAFRNAINPLITIFGFQLSGLLSGAALTEIVTAWPGMGRMMLEAVRAKDIYLVMAGLMMGSILLVIGNLVADILLSVVDPRIRYD